MTEPPYRLDEARRVIDAHECQTRGHDWELTHELGSEYPKFVLCRRDCGIAPATITPPGR